VPYSRTGNSRAEVNKRIVAYSGVEDRAREWRNDMVESRKRLEAQVAHLTSQNKRLIERIKKVEKR
jgi:hypothetical protein